MSDIQGSKSLTMERPERDAKGERALTLALVITGVRCILQYALLPFVLPLLGVAGAFSVPITTVFTIVSISSSIYSIRRLFRVNYRHKWAYALVAVTAIVIAVSFLMLDAAAMR